MREATITTRNVWSTVTAGPAAERVLDEKLKVWVKNAERTWAYRSGAWDGYERHFEAGRFRTGLLNRVTKLLREAGCEVSVIDKTVRPSMPTRAFDIGKKPWAHQIEAITEAVIAGRGTLYHATGAGKTDTMSGLIDTLGLKTLMVVDQKSIAIQTAKRWKEQGHKVGIWAAGKHTDGDVVCATFQTLGAAMRNPSDKFRRWLASFQVLLIDEAHHLVAKTYQAVADAVPAYFRFAFSATPFKSSGVAKDGFKDVMAALHVIGTAGPVLSEYRSRDGIRDKILTPPHITMLNWEGRHPTYGWEGKDFAINDDQFEYTGRKATRKRAAEVGLYDVAVVENRERNKAIVRAVSVLREDELPTLVLVERTAHGYELKRLIQQEFDDHEVVAFIHGQTPQDEREAKLKALGDGTLPVLIASKIVDEGIDVPSIGALVFAAGGRAAHRYAQRIGRGMRRAEGKTVLQVVDMFDTHSRTMWHQSKARQQAYEREGFTVEVVE